MSINRSPSADRAKNQVPPRASSNGDGITKGSVVFAATLQLEKSKVITVILIMAFLH
jgi:hypothetical protein